MKQYLIWTVVIAVLLTLTGCGSQHQSKIQNTSVSQAPAKVVKLKGSKISGIKGSTLSVTSTISNETGESVKVKPNDLKLKIGAKTLLSPASASKIPSEVKANSSAEVRLDFSVKGLPAGKIEPVLLFKPETGQAAPELTQLPSVEIKH